MKKQWRKCTNIINTITNQIRMITDNNNMNTINNKKFRNANEAYEYIHDRIIQDGVDFAGTKALFNVGFYITDPMDNKIINKERNWKEEYAEAEGQWYLSGDPKVSTLGDIYGKIHTDPNHYDNNVVYNKVNEYYKYYYDKYNKQ